MYIPPANRNDDLPELMRFMQANSFASMISMHAGEPVATHLPLQVISDDGALRVEGHVAKANPQWQSLEAQPLLVIFSGPHAYISPTNYAENTGVPTWNYTAVHLYGRATLYHDAENKLRILRRLQGHYEHTSGVTFSEQSAQFQEGQLKGIVAFDIHISQFEGKYKLSQNRSHEDQEAVARWLEGSALAAPRATAAMMREHMRKGERST